jgi:hypothetical protein
VPRDHGRKENRDVKLEVKTDFHVCEPLLQLLIIIFHIRKVCLRAWLPFKHGESAGFNGQEKNPGELWTEFEHNFSKVEN